MKLVFIYGPPAVGKLTVAKVLAQRTNFKPFHNHLTVDVVMSFFEHGSESYYKMVREIRFAMFEEAIRLDVGKMAAEEAADAIVQRYRLP